MTHLKFVFIAIFVFFMAFPALAQFHLDGQIGPQLTYIQQSNTRDLPNRLIISNSEVVGGFIGLSPSFGLSSRWSVALDVHYSFRQFRSKSSAGNFPNNNILTNNQYHFVDFTPKVRFHLRPKIALQMGGYWSSKLLERWRVKGAAGGWVKDNSRSKNQDYGLAPGVLFQFGRYALFANVQIGMCDLLESGYYDDFANFVGENRYTRNVQIGGACRFK